MFLVVAVLAGSTLAFAWQARELKDLKTPAPAVALKPAQLENVADYKCVRCHAAVAAEWRTTAHAIAWVDEEYIAQLADKKRPETCWGCHAPEPLFKGKLSSKPSARDDARHLGVNCESCHLGPDDKVLGPRGTPTSAHASAASEVFTQGRADELCIACHRFNIGPVVGIAKDFVTEKLAERGLSCMGCHAADVEMKFASKGDGEDPPLRKGKSHALQTPRDPAFLARAFEFVLDTQDGNTVVLVKNRAGHRVPGLIGRRIEFSVTAFDVAGKELARKASTFDASAYLPVSGEIPIALGVSAAAVRIVGRHVDPRAESAIEFVDTRLERQR